MALHGQERLNESLFAHDDPYPLRLGAADLMDTGSSLRGILLVAAATFFWSLSGVFVRWLPGIDPWSFNAFRGLGLGVSMALWIVLRYGRGSVALLRRSPIKGLLISAGFFALGSSLYIA